MLGNVDDFLLYQQMEMEIGLLERNAYQIQPSDNLRASEQVITRKVISGRR